MISEKLFLPREMATRSPASIEQYLSKYGDWSRNKKLAQQVGIAEANTLKPADLNKRLAQRLYELGYCVHESGKLLEESKCPRGAVAPAQKQAKVVIGQQRARSSPYDPQYLPEYEEVDEVGVPYYYYAEEEEKPFEFYRPEEEEPFEFYQPEEYEEMPQEFSEYYEGPPAYLSTAEIISRLPKVPGSTCGRR